MSPLLSHRRITSICLPVHRLRSVSTVARSRQKSSWSFSGGKSAQTTDARQRGSRQVYKTTLSLHSERRGDWKCRTLLRFDVRAGLRPSWAWCCSPEKGLFFLSIGVSWRGVCSFDTHCVQHRQKGLACNTTRLYWTQLHNGTAYIIWLRHSNIKLSNIKLSAAKVC